MDESFFNVRKLFRHGRFEVLDYLIVAHRAGLYSELRHKTGVSPSTLSNILRDLILLGLIEKEKVGGYKITLKGTKAHKLIQEIKSYFP